MTAFLDKLNLRPQERRMVVIVGIVVFVVLNLLLVRPYFGELGRTQQRKLDVRRTLNRYQEELRREPEYRRELNRLQTMGQFVATDQQALELMREVQSRAVASGINVLRQDPRPNTSGRTNAFFDEATLTITFNSGEKELVDFLYSLSSTGTLTRVGGFTIGRDPSQTRLAGTMTLVKSFQRKAPAKAPAPPAVAAAGVPKVSAAAKRPSQTPAAVTRTNTPVKPPGSIAKAPVRPGTTATNAPIARGKAAAPPGKAAVPTPAASTNWFKRLVAKWF